MEEKIKELEDRLEKLERIEKRRKIRNIIILIFYGLILITIIVGCIVVYNKLKPYKDKIDNISNLGNNIIKRDEVVDGNDGIYNFDGFNGLDGFDFFSDFFN